MKYLKLYLWFVILISLLTFIFGFAGPIAISASSDIAVAFGIGIAFIGVPCLGFVIYTIVSILKEIGKNVS